MLWFIILPKDRDRAISNSKTRFRAKMRTLNLQMHVHFYYCCAFPCLAQRLNIHVRVEMGALLKERRACKNAERLVMTVTTVCFT